MQTNESEDSPVLNRITAFRTAKSLSIPQLAEKARIAAQMLHEIETGRKVPRAAVALTICTALEENLDQVFPGTKPILAAAKRQGKPMAALSEREYEQAMYQAGIDTNPAVWSLRYMLRGGAGGLLAISGNGHRSIPYALHPEDSSDRFVIFETHYWRVAINLNHLLFCQLLYDAPASTPDEEESNDTLEVFLTAGAAPLEFSVDGDREDLDSAPPDSTDPLSTQLQGMMSALEYFDEHEGPMVHFVDADGESAFIRVDDLAMIKVPLWALDPGWTFFDEEESLAEGDDSVAAPSLPKESQRPTSTH
jgi:transcriptional regulator with XRE-family HTH domain